MPPTRSLLILPLMALAPLLALGASKHLRQPSSFDSLRIDAFTSRRLQVRLSSTPAGLALDSLADSVQTQLLVWTPATVAVADSVQTLHVVVLGAGAVQLHFGVQPRPPLSLTPVWGRDITLVRREDGRFQPVPRAHLLP